MKIYVASSWRNPSQSEVVAALRSAGHDVYDFRNPQSGGPPGAPDRGFAWSEIDPDWLGWNGERFRDLLLTHPTAERGFRADADALAWCDVCVLLLPSGRSAHLEAGWAAGAGKRLVILLAEENEPELMYRFAAEIVCSLGELVEVLA